MEIKDLEALSTLAVNVRKLAKFQKQDHKDKLYPVGVKNRGDGLFKIYSQLIDQLILHSETYLNPENDRQHRGIETKNLAVRGPRSKTNPGVRGLKKTTRNRKK